MTESAFEVPAGPRRELTSAERFAGRAAPEPAPPDVPERVVSLRALLDSLSMALVVLGCGVGVAAAWLAGGTVPGLSTIAGCLIFLGLLLTV